MSDTAALLETATERLFGDYAAAGEELPEGLWSAIEDMGLPLALVPESAGGSGLNFSDVAPVLRAIGRFAVGAPLAETMAAAWLLAEAGLPVPPGVLTFAPVREGGGVRLWREADAWRCSGTLRRVPWADTARAIVVCCEHQGRPHLAQLGREACDRVPGANVAGQMRATVTFDLALGDDAVAALPEACDPMRLGAAVRTAQIAGALQDLVGLTAEYAQTRVQFGRPIGKFQAVQHLLAALAGHAAVALAASDLAAEAVDERGDGLGVAIAKASASAAAGEGAAIAHQVHGAIGMTREHRLHRSTLRLLSWRDEFGGEAQWQAEVGRAAFATAGGPALWERLAP